MLSLALLAGIWTSSCIQTQISNINTGHVKETYSISKTGEFEFTREWFRDADCTDPKGTDSEAGTIQLGEKISTIFHPGEVYAADFNTQKGVDLGAVSISGSKLKIARGVANSSMRNTMLSLFEYTKSN